MVIDAGLDGSAKRGLPPLAIHPEAYNPIEESEL